MQLGLYAQLDYNTHMDSTSARFHNARLRDVRQLRTLFVRSLETDFPYFPGSYKAEVNRQHSQLSLAASLLKKQRLIILARVQNQMAGYIIASGHADGVGEIYWLYVQPAYRRYGLGRGLVVRTLKDLHRLDMQAVRLMTYDSDNYYAKFGFRQSGTYDIHDVTVKIMKYHFKDTPHGSQLVSGT